MSSLWSFCAAGGRDHQTSVAMKVDPCSEAPQVDEPSRGRPLSKFNRLCAMINEGRTALVDRSNHQQGCSRSHRQTSPEAGCAKVKHPLKRATPDMGNTSTQPAMKWRKAMGLCSRQPDHLHEGVVHGDYDSEREPCNQVGSPVQRVIYRFQG